jgi:hypothetical protein
MDNVKGDDDLRSSTKSTLLRLSTYSRKTIRNNSHKQIDQPEIEDDNRDNEEEA